ncbi:MAG: WYL domain-containing protein [Anaerolineaceae bacterium]
MRADRLISLLILLQTRGKMPAAKLAKELGVSVRTIHRDVQALSMGGVPVYTEHGPDGGIALLENYRTNLTGLNQDEIRALFLLGIPQPLEQLGWSEELKTALLKLTAALPAARSMDETQTRQRLLLDTSGWTAAGGPIPLLRPVQQALWENRRLWLVYSGQFGTQLTFTVNPLGLVNKEGEWWLVCQMGDHLRVLEVRKIQEVKILDEVFVRPSEFDLNTFWQGWCAKINQMRPVFTVQVRVSPAMAAGLHHFHGINPRQSVDQAARDAENWLLLTLDFETLDDARNHLLPLGCAVEVLSPQTLCLSMEDYARQILQRYEP